MKPFPIEFEDFLHMRCNAFVATAIIGAGIVGGLATAYSANKASQAQQAAANTAAGINEQQLQLTSNINTQNQENLAPFRAIGTGANDILQNQLPTLANPAPFVAPDVVNETNAPGYDFTKTQGLKAVQNSAAARGLGSSGAALKGAATFATGLANSTYGDVYNRAVTGYNTNLNAQSTGFNRLKGLIDTGEAAAAGAATAGNQSALIGTTGANNVGSNVIAGGNAAAAGYNALGTAVNNTSNNIAGYAIAKGLYGNNNSLSSGANNNTGY